MLSELKSHLQKAIDHLRSEFSKIQTGRAHPAMVEGIQVESYGSMMPLKSLANVSAPEAQTLRVEPWDKSLVGAVEKAIQEARLGINPQNMGEYILLPIPPMTEERRKDIVKLVHVEKEQAKIAVRNIRHDEMKKVKHQKDEKTISEDEVSRLEKQIQDQVDESNAEIDDISSKKESDILTI